MKDQELLNIIAKEYQRQSNNIELIASENFVSEDILMAVGSCLTNKYAEGYPSKRYYGGCTFIDEIETLAITRAKKLFNCKYANVQPHCGSSANMAVYRALLNHKDKILAMALDQGGHLTHGFDKSFSGCDYTAYFYGVNKDGFIDYEQVRKISKEVMPKMIIAGASAYPREIDFKEFRKICDEIGAYLVVDMAHIAGIVAAKECENPCDYADVVTSTTHKTLRGPRGGLILTNNLELSKKINKSVFPGIQGGPLMHVIAGKALCFKEALDDSFKDYIKQVLKNTKKMAETFMELGYEISSNGSDNHLILLNTYKKTNLTGKDAQDLLDLVNITVNKNQLPFDTLPPNLCSGIRIGTQAMTTKGFKESDIIKTVYLINDTLLNLRPIEEIKNEVLNLIRDVCLKNNV